MKSFEYIITDELGIHARPAGNLVNQSKNFESIINITLADKTVSAKSIMAIMTLGAKKSDKILITIEGSDENEAYDVLLDFMAKNL